MKERLILLDVHMILRIADLADHLVLSFFTLIHKTFFTMEIKIWHAIF